MRQQDKQKKIGFIGQGWIGKNYADNFEERGYDVVKYAKEIEYNHNKRNIPECDITFIAVPTPTTPEGFDDSNIRKVLKYVGDGKIAVIKSTILPGTTEKMQEKYPNKIILHSPEFLTEATAKYDADHPRRNIIGYVTEEGREAANEVMRTLPDAPYKSVIPARTAETIKYAGNCWFYFKVMYVNLLYDLCQKMDVDYEMVKEAMGYDPRIGFTHLDPVHKTGRGAGGHCFIKDFAVFRKIYKTLIPDDNVGHRVLEELEQKNIDLLLETGKDLELLKDVYGEDIENQT